MSFGGGVGQSPLQHVLPWSSKNTNSNNNSGSKQSPAPTTIVIQDTLETSGRFLLYLIAKDASVSVSTSTTTTGIVKRKVLWLSCTASQNERLIRQGLAKLPSSSSSAAAAPSVGSARSVHQNDTITICNVVEEFETAMRESPSLFDPLKFVQQKLYQKIVKPWIVKQQQQQGDQELFIFVEDISALATLVGARLAHAFVFQLQALQQKLQLQQQQQQQKQSSFSLVITCAGEDDGDSKDAPLWVGAGGESDRDHAVTRRRRIAWESSLMELADWIVDVVPLTTGMSRNVHGRIIITTTPQTPPTASGTRASTSTTASSPSVPLSSPTLSSSCCMINYCFSENQVWATRVQKLEETIGVK
mmetsp:Transcript_21758/g.28133  ORF Transcript_21758/g.28133 Transcript_21758/m.28133 type:complete len:360 (+) Transcript_21758:142-1221(+)